MAIPAPDGEHWVTVETFRDLFPGIIARSALEAADIPCFLRDENTVRMDWGVSNAIGGMRLQVMQQDEEAAREYCAAWRCLKMKSRQSSSPLAVSIHAVARHLHVVQLRRYLEAVARARRALPF
jgi:hypothetical protein